jgi:hypothetical protein
MACMNFVVSFVAPAPITLNDTHTQTHTFGRTALDEVKVAQPCHKL